MCNTCTSAHHYHWCHVCRCWDNVFWHPAMSHMTQNIEGTGSPSTQSYHLLHYDNSMLCVSELHRTGEMAGNNWGTHSTLYSHADGISLGWLLETSASSTLYTNVSEVEQYKKMHNVEWTTTHCTNIVVVKITELQFVIAEYLTVISNKSKTQQKKITLCSLSQSVNLPVSWTLPCTESG